MLIRSILQRCLRSRKDEQRFGFIASFGQHSSLSGQLVSSFIIILLQNAHVVSPGLLTKQLLVQIKNFKSGCFIPLRSIQLNHFYGMINIGSAIPVHLHIGHVLDNVLMVFSVCFSFSRIFCLVAIQCQLPEAAHSELYSLKVDILEYYVQ